MHSLCAETIVSAIKDSLLRLDLQLSDARGQCYDGASNMTGRNKGVVQIMQNEEPRCIFTHCYSHALSLACKDMVRNCDLMATFLDITYDAVKLIKLSPKRQSILDAFKEDSLNTFPGIRVLCPT